MRSLVVLFVAGMAALWGCSVEPGPLSTEDFVVAGVTEKSDSLAVRELLGEADSVVTYDHPFDVRGKIPTHYYPDLIVSYGPSGTPNGLMLTGPEVETARGLKVGDTVERVRELYGEPSYADAETFRFADPDEPSGLHVIQIEIGQAAVRRIFAGWLLD